MSNASLSADDVRQIAKLANLELSESEVTKFQHQLSNILEYVSQLQQINTDGIEPTAQVTGLENISRQTDEVGSRTLSPDDALSNAVQKHNNYFLVPAILEQGD